jgi:hypothetical protein
MDTTYVILIVCLIPIFIVISAVLRWKMQSPEAYKEKIIKQLDEKGYQLINISIPGLFKTGPFSKFRIILGQDRLIGISGERTFYRIVKYKNQNGIIRQSWIRIDVNNFLVVRINWIPEP